MCSVCVSVVCVCVRACVCVIDLNGNNSYSLKDMLYEWTDRQTDGWMDGRAGGLMEVRSSACVPVD